MLGWLDVAFLMPLSSAPEGGSDKDDETGFNISVQTALNPLAPTDFSAALKLCFGKKEIEF